MATKQEVLSRFNEVIHNEKGNAVTLNSMWSDAELDSLGTVIALITIDSEFHIFDTEDPEKDLSGLDFPNLTIRDLVVKCVLSTTNISMVPKTKEPT